MSDKAEEQNVSLRGHLSEAHIEALQLGALALEEGDSKPTENKVIAHMLGISERAVEGRFQRAAVVLGVTGKNAAISEYRKRYMSFGRTEYGTAPLEKLAPLTEEQIREILEDAPVNRNPFESLGARDAKLGYWGRVATIGKIAGGIGALVVLSITIAQSMSDLIEGAPSALQ